MRKLLRFSVLATWVFVWGSLQNLVHGQETHTVTFDNAANWTGNMTGYTNDKGYNQFPEVSFSATNALRETASTQDGFPATYLSSTYAWRLQDAAGSQWTALIPSVGVSTFSVRIRRWDNSPDPNWTLRYSTDNGATWTNVATINNAGLGSSDYKEYTGTINSGAANIRVQVIRTGGERIMIDQFVFTEFSACSAPATPTITTSPGSYCTSVNVARGTPPVDETWYWQTTVSGTSTANSGATLTVSSTQTVYLRARKSCGTWSTASASAAITIEAPLTAPAISGATAYCAGQTLTLTVPNLGAGVSYQWRRNTTNLINGSGISGVTTTWLTITPVSAAHAGTYDLVATNTCGSVTATGVAVTVDATFPTLTSFSPASGPVGTWVNLTGTGFATVTDVLFDGQSATDFIIRSATALTAIAPVGLTTGKIELVHAGSCPVVSSTNFTSIASVCASGAGTVFISEVCDPLNAINTNRYIEIFNGTTATVDLTGWKLRAIANNSECFTWNLSGTIASGQAKVAGNSSATFTVDFGSSSWNTGNSCHFNWNGQERDGAILYNASNVVVDKYKRGTTDTDDFTDATAVRNSGVCGGTATFTPGEWTVTAVTNAGSGASTPGTHSGTTCSSAFPVITSQPAAVALCAGSNAVFTVAATGITGYQWYRFRPGTDADFVLLSGATSASLTVSSVSTAMNGYLYYCRALNGGACYVASNAVRLNVLQPLTVTWTGRTSQSWNEPRNWSSWDVPGDGSSLTFNSTAVSALDLTTLNACFSSVNTLVVNNITAFANALTKDLTVTNALTLTAGKLPTGSFKVLVTNSSAGAVSGAGGWVHGKLVRAVGATGVNYLFPVGTSASRELLTANWSVATDYPSVQAEFITASASFTMSDFAATYNIPSSPMTCNRNGYNSIKNIWDLSGVGGGTSAGTYNLLLNPSSPQSGSSFNILTRSGTSGPWAIAGLCNAASTASNILSENLTSFSQKTDGASPDPFPVEWVTFDARAVDANTVQLDWLTAQERNSAGFVVERGLTPDVFQAVGFVPSVQATSASVQAYRYLDTDFMPSRVLYYRLKQTDLDGRVAYSQIREVQFTFKGIDWALGPNPVADELQLVHTAAWDERSAIRILDATGRYVQLPPAITYSPDRKVASYSVGQLSQGVYYVQVQSLTGVHTLPFVKLP
jgi:hypothetical protein